MDDQRGGLLGARIAKLTKPLNGQYPRPWMTNSRSPWCVPVFTVGRNQRNGFSVEAVGSHENYLNALFNRNGSSCRSLYDRLTEKPSPTRINTDRLVAKLARVGITEVLETNVVCYSTSMSSDLRNREHLGGKERGTELFRTLLETIKPSVIIAHGAGTAKDLGRLLETSLPAVPSTPEMTARATVADMAIWVIPSLAPPKWNSWMRWADAHLDLVCREVAEHLKAGDRNGG